MLRSSRTAGRPVAPGISQLYTFLHSMAGTIAHLTDKNTEDPYVQLHHIGSILVAKAVSGHSLANATDTSPFQLFSFCLGNG